MRPVLTSAACTILTIFPGCVPVFAQMRDNTEKQLTCSNRGNNGDGARHCEIREQSLPSIGRLNIDASPNGGATVKGWLRGDVLVRARVEASADTEGAAANLTSRVMIDSSGGQVRATGPEGSDNSWWSVSYEIFVPQMTDVTAKTRNGGVNISDVRGQIHVDTTNGGVHMQRVAGEVTGATVNGGIDVELAGTVLDARQMEFTTHNGGVTVAMPAQYSARMQVETGMGRIQSDFPLPPTGDARARKMDFAIGGGGAPIHITTGNGSIRIKRTDSQ